MQQGDVAAAASPKLYVCLNVRGKNMDKFLQLLIPGIVLGCTYGLLALSCSIIYKASGLMSFMQGAVLTLGAFLGLTFYSFLGIPFLLSLLLTTAIAFGFGILLEKGVIRVMLNRHVTAAYIVLSTIAISYIIQNGSQIAWGTIPLYFPSIFNVMTVKILGVNIQPEAILCVIVSVICMALMHLFMTKTRFGTAMRAAAMDAKAAESCGIDVSLSTGVTWGLSAALAAVAGMLIGPIYGVYTTLGATLGRKGFSSAVIGGYGNMYGAIVGGIFLGVVENCVAGYISSNYRNLIAYIILIVFLFLRPTGIFNEKAIQDV